MLDNWGKYAERPVQIRAVLSTTVTHAVFPRSSRQTASAFGSQGSSQPTTVDGKRRQWEADGGWRFAGSFHASCGDWALAQLLRPCRGLPVEEGQRPGKGGPCMHQLERETEMRWWLAGTIFHEDAVFVFCVTCQNCISPPAVEQCRPSCPKPRRTPGSSNWHTY